LVPVVPSSSRRSSPSLAILAAAIVLHGCWAPEVNKDQADQQVYSILAKTSETVTGDPRVFPLERPVDTLRKRLLTTHEPRRLTLVEALDVAAENSREFQRQKEQLYLAALNLTRVQRDFSWLFGGLGSADVDGQGDETADAVLGSDLSASANSVYGTRVLASFANTFLRSVIHGGGFDGSSILNLTLTQPLLRGSGRRIAREPLNQAERDVVYAVRSFERFRVNFTTDLVGDYWNVVAQMADLQNVEATYLSLVQSREQIEELYNAGRRTITDLGRAQQSEYSADAQRVAAKNRLQTSLDRFKLTLGLPVTAKVELDPAELKALSNRGVELATIDEEEAVQLALLRRFDHRTTIDSVQDTARRIVVAQDAMGIAIDFTAALNVPAENGRGLNLDWSRVNWSAGFQLDLNLDKLLERNAYRSALISFDAAIRAREQSADQIAADVRSALRNIQAATDTYRIQTVAVDLAKQRVDATTDLYAAGREEALELLDAQDSLLRAQLDLTRATVDHAIARLSLMNNLEAIRLEAQGLQFDLTLPMPRPERAE